MVNRQLAIGFLTYAALVVGACLLFAFALLDKVAPPRMIAICFLVFWAIMGVGLMLLVKKTGARANAALEGSSKSPDEVARDHRRRLIRQLKFWIGFFLLTTAWGLWDSNSVQLWIVLVRAAVGLGLAALLFLAMINLQKRQIQGK